MTKPCDDRDPRDHLDPLAREALAKRMAAEAFPAPDLVLWLRLPVAQALARLGQDATERFEKREFLERVDAEYEALGLVAIDASGTAEQVAAALQARVVSVLSAG